MRSRLTAWIAVFCCATSGLRGQSQSFTSGDFNDWASKVGVVLGDGAQGQPPGYGFNWNVDVCVGDELYHVGILVVISQSGTPVSHVSVVPLGTPCQPSVDQFGNPLSNPGTVFSPTITYLPGSGPPGGSPQIKTQTEPLPAASAATPSNAYVFTAPFRDIPFPPLYLASAYPTPPPCNPSLNASLLIVNHDNSSVTRMMACTGQQVAEIAVPDSPLQVSGTPDAATAIVTSFSGAVSFIDLTSNQVTGTLNLPNDNPSGIAISPDGTLAYVTSFTATNPVLRVINISQQSVVQTIQLTGYPQSVILTPDGSQAWVTNPIDGNVTVVDLLSGTVSRQFALNRPIGVAFNSTATQAWITTGDGTVRVLDTSTYTTIQTITVGAGPADVLIAPDDSVAFVNNFGGQTMSVINPLTFAVLNTISLPGPPMGLAITQ